MLFPIRCQTCDRKLRAAEEWHPVGPQKFVCSGCKGRQKEDAVLLLQVPVAATDG